jgi:hypothetical protein
LAAAFINCQRGLLPWSHEPEVPPCTRYPELPLSGLIECLTCANFDLWLGNLEMDIENGELRFKNSMQVEGPLTSDAIDDLVIGSLGQMERYYPAFMCVLFADVSPGDAINEVENE